MSLERFFQDLRYAFRMYARTPVFTGVYLLPFKYYLVMSLGFGYKF